MIKFLEIVLLLSFSFFLIFAPYGAKLAGRVVFIISSLSIVLIMFLKYKGKFYRWFIENNPLNRLFLFFGLSCLFSVIFSLDIYHSQSVFFDRYLVYFVFFLSGAFLVKNNKRNIYILASVFLLAGFIFAGGGLKDYLYYKTNTALIERLWSAFRIRIPYYGFPLYLTYFIPISFAVFLFARNRWLRIAGGVNLIITFSCLILNTSRAAWLAVLFSVFLLSLIKVRNSRFLGLLIFMLFLLLSFISPHKQQRLKTIINPQQWSYRMPLYNAAFNIFRDYPITGTGIGTFEKVLHYKKYELPQDYSIPKELNLHAHNTYLEVASEMGLIGLFAFVGIFVFFFKKLFRRIFDDSDKEFSPDERAITIGLAATIFSALIFAFSATYITVGINNSTYFWFLFGMAAGSLAVRIKNQ